ncbi:MAG TPA: ABC transporter permease, partial [Micromonosporaceae bacterium]|nr:ABC transporter permease [Micromonosporaceae bacterium]
MTTVTAPARTAPGGAPGYRPGATLTYATEFRRQLSRRRTQLTLGFMIVLPVIILIAFELGRNDNRGGGGERGQFGALANIATAGGLNFALFTLLVSASFLLVVVVALFCGDTVASEASWGSLRYLLAIPVPRARLLGTKLRVALTYCGIALILLTGMALAVGTARYGWHPLRST